MEMIENTSSKSTLEKAARDAQILKGTTKLVSGIITGNAAAAVRGAADLLSPRVAAIIIGIVIFIILLPVIIISAVPQMVFSWGTVNDAELIARNQHGNELVESYTQIISEQETGVNPDVDWLISIESVLHRQDVESISESDIEKSVERSYTIDPETGEVYNKTPDEIMNELNFTDEEKNWAELLHSSLSDQKLDPNSEYADVGGLEDYEGVVLGAEGETQVVYYNQLDKRWAGIKYGRSGTIGSSGCGPTSLAIVVSTLTGRTVTPVEVSEWSVANGHRCEGSGSYHSLIPEGAKHYGLKVEKLGTSSAKELAQHLSSGKLVIAIMAKGHFTSGGHFIVLRGITGEGKVLVADCASYKRSSQEWDMSIILNEARATAAAGGPFWSISK